MCFTIIYFNIRFLLFLLSFISYTENTKKNHLISKFIVQKNKLLEENSFGDSNDNNSNNTDNNNKWKFVHCDDNAAADDDNKIVITQ